MKIIDKKQLNIKVCGKTHTIILEKWGEDKGYVARVVNLPEIITEGKNITEAKKMAKEAIELCLECEQNEHYSNFKSKRHLTTPLAAGL